MAAHRSGPLKQQNKAHKGGRHRGRGSAQRDGKGENVGLEGEGLSRCNCYSPCPAYTPTSGLDPALMLSGGREEAPFLDLILVPFMIALQAA